MSHNHYRRPNSYILDYSFPDYVQRLLPEYWADIDGDWIQSFVIFSRTINDGSELIESIPIHPEIYIMAPTYWASAPDGISRYIWPIEKFLHDPLFSEFEKFLHDPLSYRILATIKIRRIQMVLIHMDK